MTSSVDFKRQAASTKANTFSCPREFQSIRKHEWSEIPLENEPSVSESAPILNHSILSRVNTFLGASNTKAKVDSCTLVQGSTCPPSKNQQRTNERIHADIEDSVVCPLASLESLDPFKGMANGPRVPSNPCGLPLKPVGRQIPNFKPPGSQHNTDSILNCQHPYQNLQDSKSWVNKLKAWFHSEGAESQPRVWPQPITFNVANSINQSTSSLVPVFDEYPEANVNSGQMVYTPQALPVGAEKQQTNFATRESHSYWCVSSCS